MAADNGHGLGLDQADDVTAALIVQLQEEDLQKLKQLDKGKGREGDRSDADIAMVLYQEELHQVGTVLKDRYMSRSLERAVVTDSALLTDAVAKEDTLANDRLLAEHLARGDEVKSDTEVFAGNPSLDDHFIARLTALYVSEKEDDNFPVAPADEEATDAESSQWASTREKTTGTARYERRPPNSNQKIGHTVLDLRAPPSSHQLTLVENERRARPVSLTPAPSVRVAATMATVLGIAQHSRYLKPRKSRVGNAATIADGL
ncbi:MAG: hypothetical protein Q9201_001895 [Fulgogasparrea decipioides]